MPMAMAAKSTASVAIQAARSGRATNNPIRG